MEKPGPDFLKNQRPCSKCGAPIGFLETSQSRFARIGDPSLAPKHHILDVKPELRITTSGESVWVFSSHWATCPKAAEVRAEQIAKKKEIQARMPLGHAAGEPEQHGPRAEAPCDACGARRALAPGLPVCAPCWNAMTPEEQARVRTLHERIERLVNLRADPRGRCRYIDLGNGNRAIVCGPRPRRRR